MQKSVQIAPNETRALTVGFFGGPGQPAAGTVVPTYSSSNTAICTVTNPVGSGITLTGVSAGTATITAQAGGLSATLVVTVLDPASIWSDLAILAS